MNPLENVSASLLVKLGSIGRHVEELCGPCPHVVDKHAIEALLGDPEVQEWMAKMDALALLPVPR